MKALIEFSESELKSLYEVVKRGIVAMEDDIKQVEGLELEQATRKIKKAKALKNKLKKPLSC